MPSQKILEKKQQQVADLAEKLKNSCSGVLVDYKGINVADDTKLRKELREAGVDYSVVKNTLLSRAAEIADREGLKVVLEGTTAIAICKDDYVTAAKILTNFAKTNKNFEIKLGYVDDSVIDANGVDALAKLPSRKVLVAQALGGLNAPITSFVGVLHANLRGLACVINAIAEKQGA